MHYFAPDFKEYLSVFDFNGEKLQFHGELTDYFDIEYSNSELKESNKDEDNKQIPDDNPGFQILIDFPKERPLLKSEFRTIILTDKIDYLINHPGRPISIDVPFDEASHTYLYVNKLPQYTAKIDKIFYSRKDIDEKSKRPKIFFELEESEEKEYLDHFEATSYYCIYSSVPITDCNIFIVIEYKLRGKDWSWFYSGILFGISALALNLHLMINNLHGSLVQIVSVCTIATTYLVVIKGWVFMKDIDDVVGLIPVDLPFKIRFSYVYLFLILLIFIELMIAIYCGTIN